jgi:hypothetical protein
MASALEPAPLCPDLVGLHRRIRIERQHHARWRLAWRKRLEADMIAPCPLQAQFVST